MPCPAPGNLLNPGIKPASLESPALARAARVQADRSLSCACLLPGRGSCQADHSLSCACLLPGRGSCQADHSLSCACLIPGRGSCQADHSFSCACLLPGRGSRQPNCSLSCACLLPGRGSYLGSELTALSSVAAAGQPLCVCADWGGTRNKTGQMGSPRARKVPASSSQGS